MHKLLIAPALALLGLMASGVSFAGEFCETSQPEPSEPPPNGHECYQSYAAHPHRPGDGSVDALHRDLSLQTFTAPFMSQEKQTIALSLCGLDAMMPTSGQESAHVIFAEIGFAAKDLVPGGSIEPRGHVLQLSAWNAPDSNSGPGAHYLLVEWQITDRPDWSIIDARNSPLALAMSSVIGPLGDCDGSIGDQRVEITAHPLYGVQVKIGDLESPWYLYSPLVQPVRLGKVVQTNQLSPYRLRAGLLDTDGIVTGNSLTMMWDGVKTPLPRP